MPRRPVPGALVLALGLLLGACSSTSHGTTGAGTTAPSGTSPTTIGQVVLAAGQEGPESSVPWSQVGPGWFLAEWAPTAAPTNTDAAVAIPPGTILYLVDPGGGRYRIASGSGVPNGQLVAWSGDGQRALFEAQAAGGTAPGFSLLDAATGATSQIPLPQGAPGLVRTVAFTKPHGLGIVESGWYETSPSTVVPVQRYDLTGKLQTSYPANGFPPPTTALTPGTAPIPFLYTPDGTQLLVGSVGGLNLVGNDGLAIAGSVTDPSGSADCTPLSWWAADEALLTCATASGNTLWLQPLNGNAPIELATEGASSDQAWQLTGGIFATNPRCVGSACTGIGRLSPDGTLVTPIGVPQRGPAQELEVATSNRDSLAIFGRPDPAPNRGFLEWLNPDTGSVTQLLGGLVNEGSVNQVIAQPPAAPPAPTATASSPHFDTPQAAMAYLASAWNRNDLTQLGFVTNPPARAALTDMHSDATNLRLNHCTARPQGDYICYFDHDYLPGTAPSSGAAGQAVFLAGPAAKPGWYMTVFETCN